MLTIPCRLVAGNDYLYGGSGRDLLVGRADNYSFEGGASSS